LRHCALPGTFGEMPSDLARAKINLALHVLGRRPDGYHVLDSLVAFATVADTVTFTPADHVSLTVDGPTASAAGAGPDNLILRAEKALAQRVPGLSSGHFHLVKRLPVAAGIGGGSADAAAALRLLASASGLSMDDPRLVAAALETGADVPACLLSSALLMRGAGEAITPVQGFTPLQAVLVNPGAALSTAPVFAALGLEKGTETGLSPMPASLDLNVCRNDLAAPARALLPVIADVEAALAQAGAVLVRMSGSGATVFGLFKTGLDASAAAERVSAAHPKWWVVATELS
jgi:4-diphosphocytidyl-2-C-methyl-D-erythritol kinase